ncbi:phosphatase PAP2 family protein [Mannheimia massilioguelmaensis]|uniref:phosphatase PAP2 family protein n=1 Tax=Mannheimia massilioguelmaensis TaxID=1604354 RepID=UPI0005C9300E|nr:phosphatase PAP2 family protein [Mannheimia massilioguelmaensis]
MLKRLSLYTLLLCLVPIFAWISGWHWQGDEEITNFDHFLYWLTETSTAPYALMTCGVFALLFFPFAKTKNQWIFIVLVLAFSTVITQGVKTGLKHVFAEPRPYVEQLAQDSGASAEYFYDQTKAQRKIIVNNYYTSKAETPTWLVKHRMEEVSYSFPSGHTIFAVSWLLLVAGFMRLLNDTSIKAKIFVFLTALWAVLMLISRLRLGMHYPIDLLVSALISWGLHCALFIFLEKKQFFAKDFAPRCLLK